MTPNRFPTPSVEYKPDKHTLEKLVELKTFYWASLLLHTMGGIPELRIGPMRGVILAGSPGNGRHITAEALSGTLRQKGYEYFVRITAAAHKVCTAITHITEQDMILPGNGRNQCRTHAGQRCIRLRAIIDSTVGGSHSKFRNGLHFMRRHTGAEVAQTGVDKGAHSQRAGDSTAINAAHAIANHTHKVSAVLIDANSVCILILFSHKADIREAPYIHHLSIPSFLLP